MLRVHFLFRRKQNHDKVIFYQKHMVFPIRQVEYSRPDTLSAFQPFFCPLFLVFQIRAVFFNFFRAKKIPEVLQLQVFRDSKAGARDGT